MSGTSGGGYGAMGEGESLLMNSIETNAETEAVGTATLGRLHTQREQLRGATATATDTRRVASDANVQLRDLAFKVVKEKVFLVLVILFMLCVDGGLAYLLIKNGGSLSSSKR